MNWLLVSVTMPLTERSLANQSHFHLIFLSEPQGPSFHRLTKELYVDGEGRGVCVCVGPCESATEGRRERWLKYVAISTPKPPALLFSF